MLDEFLLEMEMSHKSRNTIVNYRSDIKSFLNTCTAGIENLTTEELRRHISGLNHKSPTTRARHLSSLKKFLGWCYKRDFIPDNPILNPILKIKREKPDNFEIKKVKKSEIQRIISSITDNNLKYKLIFTLMLEAGLKTYEVLNLEYENIETEIQTIFVNSECPRRIPLFSPGSIKLFRVYTEKFNIKSGFLFKGGETQGKTLSYQALNKFWRKSCAKANADVKLYQLRDCYAKELVERGINICIIGQMLGHKNFQTTVKYMS
ncbi:MAG: hypothetical protein A2Y25_04580 [Candidatus Melainabacteria bacterium GWF2_37_15]|nr:MAG: hypothetical protein A2Y25_04580 [Candidatus Melainabacteria bacterium GWF2_37_15]